MLQEFGLGVIIQATDKASQVFNQVKDSFGNLQSTIAGGSKNISKDMLAMQEVMATSIMGHTLENLGHSFITQGKQMLDWVVDFAKGIISVGDSVDKTRITLGALYKSAEAGQQKMNEITQYALKTPFEISELTSIVTMFKAIGIEALGLESMVTSTTGRTSELLSVMSDLASLQPQIPFSMASYAVKEYIAEGNTISLLRRMSLDIRSILGRELGDTIEERKKDIADLVEKLGAEGLTDKLFGTWTQALSNFSDFFFNIRQEIADAGMFSALKETLNYVGGIAQGLDPETVKRFAKSVSDGFMTIYKPVDRVVRKLGEFAEKVITYIADNPWVARLAFGFSAVAGALTIVSGIVLILGGYFLMLSAGLQFITTGLLAQRIAGVGVALKGSLFFFAKFLAIAGLVYYAWKTNFLGIRDFAQDFGKGMMNVFDRVSAGLKTNGRTFAIFTEALLNSEDAYSRFAGKILKFVAVVRGLIDVLGDDTLSEDNFIALNDLGLLPIIESALEAKKNVLDFLEGVEQGFIKFNDNVIQPYIIPFWDTLKKMGTYLKDELLPLLGFTEKKDAKSGIDEDISKYQELGETVGNLVAWVGTLYVVLKVFGGIAKVAGIVWGVFSKIGGVLKLLGGLALAHPIIALIVGAIIVVAILYKKFDSVKNIVDKVLYSLALLGAGIAVVIGVAVTAIAGVILAIIDIAVVIGGILETIWSVWQLKWDIMKEFVGGIVESIKAVFDFFVHHDFDRLVEDLKGIWSEKWDNILGLLDGWKESFKERWSSIGGFLSDTWEGFKTPVTSFFNWVDEKFRWMLEQLGIVDRKISEQTRAIAGSQKSSGTGAGGGMTGGGHETTSPQKSVNTSNRTIQSDYTKASKNKAFAIGSRFIPYDMRATVHQGEMIVPKEENPYANSGGKILPFPAPRRDTTPAPVEENYDLSVTFEAGAIILNVEKATPEEAKKLADQIMKLIDQKRELEKIRKFKRGAVNV